MNLREELFSALADAFPMASVKYRHEHGVMIFGVSAFVEGVGKVLSMSAAVTDDEALAASPSSLADLYVKAMRADWDQKIALAKAAA